MIYGTVSVEKYMFLRILYCSLLFDVPYSTKFRFIIILQCTGFTTVSWGWLHPTVYIISTAVRSGLSDGLLLLLLPRYLPMSRVVRWGIPRFMVWYIVWYIIIMFSEYIINSQHLWFCYILWLFCNIAFIIFHAQ